MTGCVDCACQPFAGLSISTAILDWILPENWAHWLDASSSSEVDRSCYKDGLHGMQVGTKYTKEGGRDGRAIRLWAALMSIWVSGNLAWFWCSITPYGVLALQQALSRGT